MIFFRINYIYILIFLCILVGNISIKQSVYCEKNNSQKKNGEILKLLKKKPKYLKLIKCSSLGNEQVVQKECYRVSGKYAHEVEKFLIKEYYMSKLVFLCCGWENYKGRGGIIEENHFINKNDYKQKCFYSLSMYSCETLLMKRDQ